MSNILHTSTVHKTASLADEGNSPYCHTTLNTCKLELRGHLNTGAQARDRTRNILLTRTTTFWDRGYNITLIVALNVNIELFIYIIVSVGTS